LAQLDLAAEEVFEHVDQVELDRLDHLDLPDHHQDHLGHLDRHQDHQVLLEYQGHHPGPPLEVDFHALHHQGVVYHLECLECL
jgi:hypothetical protein